VTSIGSYSVVIAAPSGAQFRYLHMEPSSLTVAVGDTVQQGQRIGKVSNAFGTSSTTIHMHLDNIQNVDGVGMVFVPSYMSLVRSYERLLGIPQEPCGLIPGAGATVDNSSACFSLGGNTTTWRNEQVDGAEGGSLRWSYGFEAAQPDGTARWSLGFEQGGRYKIEASILPAYGQSQRARYGVRHDGKDEEVRVNMTGLAGWRELGVFDFAAGEDQYIELRDNTGDPLTARVRIMADAIRVTPVTTTEPPADMGATPDMNTAPDMPTTTPDMSTSMDMGGGGGGQDLGPIDDPDDGSTKTAESSSCASAPGGDVGGAPLWLLALGAMAWRRRRR
jgi:MYXO-CTERM domain-containing protein